MYLAGRAHPNQDAARAQLRALALAGEPLVTDAEVLQEICHRYRALHRFELILPLLQQTVIMVTEVVPITADLVFRAAELATPHLSLSARDAIHLAVMERRRIRRIFSFDRAFDDCAGIERLPA